MIASFARNTLCLWLLLVASPLACSAPPPAIDAAARDVANDGRSDAASALDTVDTGSGCTTPCPTGQVCDAASGRCVATSNDGGASDGDGCVPDCQRRICGTDGCGGTCGSCAAGESCTNGLCQTACVPETDAALCAGLHKDCGVISATDNCGTVRTANCGTCTAPRTCGGSGQANVCGSPAGNCTGRVCGSDGAGGSCGACPAHSTCAPDQSLCGCDAGYAPSADANSCLLVGAPCPAGTPADYCTGDQYWMICDPRWGLQYLDCGAGQCQPNANGAGHGSCTCGSPGTLFPSLGTVGSCATPTWTTVANEDQFVCAAGRTYYFNCRGWTGMESGRCWGLTSAFGSQTSCYCNTCVEYDTRTRSCTPACTPYGLSCSIISSTSNIYTCQ